MNAFYHLPHIYDEELFLSTGNYLSTLHKYNCNKCRQVVFTGDAETAQILTVRWYYGRQKAFRSKGVDYSFTVHEIFCFDFQNCPVAFLPYERRVKLSEYK